MCIRDRFQKTPRQGAHCSLHCCLSPSFSAAVLRGEARFVAAYERRNGAVEAFFRGRDESHRLLVLKDPLESSAYRVWTSVCNFLEAWSACPRTRGLPGASALAERTKGAGKTHWRVCDSTLPAANTARRGRAARARAARVPGRAALAAAPRWGGELDGNAQGRTARTRRRGCRDAVPRLNLCKMHLPNQ